MVQSRVRSQATIMSLPLELSIMIMKWLPLEDALNLGIVLQLPQQVAVQYFACDRKDLRNGFHYFFKDLQPSSFKFLLKNKRFQIEADSYGKTKAAVRTLDLDFVMKYLEKVQPDLNFVLRTAIECGFTDAVKLLLPCAGVDPSAQSNNALILAARKGHLEIVKLLLLDARVDPSPQSNYALRCASENGHLDIVKLLLLDDRVYPSADIILSIASLDCVQGDLEMKKVFRSYRIKRRSKLKEKL
jgi:ankyrin repeat protein